MPTQTAILEEMLQLERAIDEAQIKLRSVERRAGQHIAARLADAGISVSSLAGNLRISSAHAYSLLNGNKRMAANRFRECVKAIRDIQSNCEHLP